VAGRDDEDNALANIFLFTVLLAMGDDTGLEAVLGVPVAAAAESPELRVDDDELLLLFVLLVLTNDTGLGVGAAAAAAGKTELRDGDDVG